MGTRGGVCLFGVGVLVLVLVLMVVLVSWDLGKGGKEGGLRKCRKRKGRRDKPGIKMVGSERLVSSQL